MKTLSIFFLSIFILSCSKNITQTMDYSMYPEAQDGYKRYSIVLPTLANEDLAKIEIWASKTELLDCNTHRLMGTFENATVKGWGYPYLTFNSKGLIMSTKKACLEEKATQKEANSESEMLHYNSKLPIIIYAPEGVEINYSVWSKGKEVKSANLF